jgi:hypothetical protein
VEGSGCDIGAGAADQGEGSSSFTATQAAGVCEFSRDMLHKDCWEGSE